MPFRWCPFCSWCPFFGAPLDGAPLAVPLWQCPFDGAPLDGAPLTVPLWYCPFSLVPLWRCPFGSAPSVLVPLWLVPLFQCPFGRCPIFWCPLDSRPKRLHIVHNRFKLWFKRTKFKYDCSKNAVFENIFRQIHVRKVGINFNALNYQLSPM